MANQQLVDYIKASLAQNQSQDQIKQNLLQSGWQETDIDEAFGSVRGAIIAVPATPSLQQDQGDSSQVKYAGFWIRYIASSIDGLIIAIAILLFGLLLAILNIILKTNSNVFSGIIANLFGFLFGPIYLILMTYKRQSTFGKKLTNLMVISDKSENLSLGQVILRETIGKIISGIILGIGYFAVGFTKRKQGLHDKIAKTLVIYKDPNKKNSILVIILGIIAPILSILAVVIVTFLLIGSLIFQLFNFNFSFFSVDKLSLAVSNNSLTPAISQSNIPEVNSSSMGEQKPQIEQQIENQPESIVQGKEGFLSTEKTQQFSCGSSVVEDIDGNQYNTVKIGNQCWLKENLKTINNPGGKAINRHCYNDNSDNCNTDGGLYDWSTAMNNSTEEGSLGICPSEWHIPSDNDWKILEISLGMSQSHADDYGFNRGANQGAELKVGGSSGYNGILSGMMDRKGIFGNRTVYAYFWTSTKDNMPGGILDRRLYSGGDTIWRYASRDTDSLSIRCLKN